MSGVLAMLGALAALTLGLLGYAASRMGQLPSGSPQELLRAGAVPSERPVLVCLGDSITQGSLGVDWVALLRARMGDDALIINAGVGGQVTWDLRQRLEEVARCQPDAIVLLTGSNDAVGALGAPWTSFYERGRPQAPSHDWFTSQYDALVGELLGITPRVACLTLPPLGEDPTTQAASNARRMNEVVVESAAHHGAHLLDVHATLLGLGTSGAPFLSGLTAFMSWSLSGILQHRLLGRSWGSIAERRGLCLTTDTIHPSDRAGQAMVDLIEPWARRIVIHTPGATSCLKRSSQGRSLRLAPTGISKRSSPMSSSCEAPSTSARCASAGT